MSRLPPGIDSQMIIGPVARLPIPGGAADTWFDAPPLLPDASWKRWPPVVEPTAVHPLRVWLPRGPPKVLSMVGIIGSANAGGGEEPAMEPDMEPEIEPDIEPVAETWLAMGGEPVYEGVALSQE